MTETVQHSKPFTQDDLARLVQRFGDRINKWMDRHGSIRNLPVFQDEKTGEWVWLNREARRKIEQRKRREFKKL